jgi:hypothetical protein
MRGLRRFMGMVCNGGQIANRAQVCRPVDARTAGIAYPERLASVTEVPGCLSKVPSKATEVPSNETEVPSKATEAPSFIAEVPCLMTKVPSNAAEVPSLTTKVPDKATEVPCGKPEVPDRKAKVPSRTAKPPGKARENPWETATMPSDWLPQGGELPPSGLFGLSFPRTDSLGGASRHRADPPVPGNRPQGVNSCFQRGHVGKLCSQSSSPNHVRRTPPCPLPASAADRPCGYGFATGRCARGPLVLGQEPPRHLALARAVHRRRRGFHQPRV